MGGEQGALDEAQILGWKVRRRCRLPGRRELKAVSVSV